MATPALSPSQAALTLARRLPALVVAARAIAASVMHGVHGRRQAGAGETFWQFRPFVAGENRAQIDWRRSARDDRTYVREREWESAHTVALWIDMSPSMDFASHLSAISKRDRALVLGLAAADLLVRGGERVSLLGVTPPLATSTIVDRLAQELAQELARGQGARGQVAELPPGLPLAPRTHALLIGDFLSEAETIAACIATLASRGARGHVVMVSDPLEDMFPLSGHVELTETEGPTRLRVGDAASLQAAYLARLATHRGQIQAACRQHGWSFALHRTDASAAQALLHLRMQFDQGLAA